METLSSSFGLITVKHFVISVGESQMAISNRPEVNSFQSGLRLVQFVEEFGTVQVFNYDLHLVYLTASGAELGLQTFLI